MTQKTQLEEAQTKITELEGKVTAAEGLQAKLDEANGKVTAAEKLAADEKLRADKAEKLAGEEKLRADKAELDLKASTDRAEKAEKATGEEKARADKAEQAVKDADQTHSEQLAARGIKPIKKAAAVQNEAPAASTPASIREQYAAIEDSEERYAFFQKHKAVLMA